MKKLLLPLVLALALLASACGDDDSTTDSGNDPVDDGTVVDGGDDPSDGEPPTDDGPLDDDAGEPPVDDGGDIDLPLGGGPYPIADLTVTYQLDEASDAVSYQLACLGDTATVTGDGAPGDAAAMCLALNEQALRDRVLLGPPADVACTEIYGGPQIATITGTLDGESVDAAFDRANGCGISDWDQFALFLPAPA